MTRVDYINPETAHKFSIFEHAVRDGKLTSFDCNRTNRISVYAQKDKVAEGQELFDLYYMDGIKRRGLSGEKAAERIAELLGYSKQDFLFFSRRGIYSLPFIHDFAFRNADKISHARFERMVSHAPKPGAPHT